MKNANEIAAVIDDLVRAAQRHEYAHFVAAKAREAGDMDDFNNQMKLVVWNREDMNAAKAKLEAFGLNLNIVA